MKMLVELVKDTVPGDNSGLAHAGVEKNRETKALRSLTFLSPFLLSRYPAHLPPLLCLFINPFLSHSHTCSKFPLRFLLPHYQILQSDILSSMGLIAA